MIRLVGLVKGRKEAPDPNVRLGIFQSSNTSIVIVEALDLDVRREVRLALLVRGAAPTSSASPSTTS